MLVAIEAYFDRETELRIEGLWNEIAQRGLPSPMRGHRPHLTVVVAESPLQDSFTVRQALRVLSARLNSFQFRLDFIGLFPTDEGVVFLAPSQSAPLLNLHTSLCTAIAAEKYDPRPYYRTETWVPHCTVSLGLDDSTMIGVIDCCRALSLPLVGRIESVGIADVPPFTPPPPFEVFELGRPPSSAS